MYMYGPKVMHAAHARLQVVAGQPEASGPACHQRCMLACQAVQTVPGCSVRVQHGRQGPGPWPACA